QFGVFLALSWVLAGCARSLSGGLAVSPSELILGPGKSLSVTASGGQPPYRYSVDPGSPVTVTSSGLLTAQWLNTTSVLHVQDAAGKRLDVPITIAPAPLQIGSANAAFLSTLMMAADHFVFLESATIRLSVFDSSGFIASQSQPWAA